MSIYTDEIIEDSEPEREELRQKEELKRKKTTGIKRNPNPEAVVSISDDSSDPVKPRPVERQDAPKESPARGLPTSRASTSPALTLGATSKDPELEDNESGSEGRLNLNQFAFKASSGPAVHRSTLKPGPSKLPPVQGASNLPHKRRPAQKPSHRFAQDFSDFELAKLLKCVSCDARWTARKGGAQKMAHIQSCAKKNLLADETIRLLIRREIAKSLEGSKNAEDLALPKTFLEDIVHEAVPKKKGKRPRVLQTVRSVTETREAIVENARMFLGNLQSVDTSDQTQVFVPSKLASALSTTNGQMHPATQAFGESALGRRAQSNGSTMFPPSDGMVASIHRKGLFDVEVSNKTNPPSTPTFASSKFASNSHRSSSSNQDAVVMGVKTMHDPSPSRSLLSLPPNYIDFPSIASSLKDPARSQSPPRTAKTRTDMDLTPVYSPLQSSIPLTGKWSPFNDSHCHSHGVDDYFSWNNGDDAFLHNNPSSENEYNQDRMTQPIQPKPSRSSRKAKPRKTPDIQESNILVMSKKANKSKEKQCKEQDIEESTDTGFESNLQEKILRNEVLYSRILRYEPIHFDTFFNIASTLGIPSRGSKLKLRAFLDMKGINFYGAEPVGRARTRHP